MCNRLQHKQSINVSINKLSLTFRGHHHQTILIMAWRTKSAPAPITAAATPIGMVWFSHCPKPIAMQSVANNRVAPSNKLNISSCLGVRPPKLRAILGVNKPIKLIIPTAVIEADTSQIQMTIKPVKAGKTAKPRALAPSCPKRNRVKTLGASSNLCVQGCLLAHGCTSIPEDLLASSIKLSVTAWAR